MNQPVQLQGHKKGFFARVSAIVNESLHTVTVVSALVSAATEGGTTERIFWWNYIRWNNFGFYIPLKICSVPDNKSKLTIVYTSGLN